MKYLNSMLYLIGIILEIGIYIYIPENIATFLTIHIFIILIIYATSKIFVKEKRKLPLYIGIFFPIIGLMVLLILELLLNLNKSKNNMIEEYEKYIEYIDKFIIKNQVNFEKEINVTSALDRLKYSANEKKKDVIIDLITEDIDLKVKILKTALKDKDSEVVHYASSTLSLLESEYEHEINFLRDSYSKKKNKETLKKLIEIYNKYIDSGLLSTELKNILLKEYLDVLTEFIDKFDEDYNVLLNMVNAHMNLDNNEECIKILKKLYKNYPQNYEHYIYSMKVFYKMRNYKKVSSIAKEVIDLNLNIPDKYKHIVDYWK